MMKVAVIGRGAIGLTCAYELAKSGNAEVTVFGSRSNSYTASRAAGAMLNVVSEVDIFNAGHPLTRWKIKNKNEVLKLWMELMQKLVEDKAITKSLLYGKGTQIIVDRHTNNKVEKESFDVMRKCYTEHRIEHSNFVKENGLPAINDDSFLINDEPSVDSQAFLDSLEKYLDTFASCINYDVIRILKYCDKSYLEVTDGQFYCFDKVILCAGSWSEPIISRSNDLHGPSRRSFFGVGSALLVSSELEYVKHPSVDRILRTPNRGGTCGIHAVQRKESLYVGASSVISNIQLKSPRASSVLALLEGLKDTVDIDISQLSTTIITGYRPVTDDAVPIIGNLDKDILVCYGTKRDGFTWSPFFAKHLTGSVLEDSYSSAQWDELLNQCSPQRRLTSAGDVDLCIENYVMNKIFESHQHGKSLSTKETDRLYSIAKDVHDYIRISEGNLIGAQPELVNMIYYIVMGKK